MGGSGTLFVLTLCNAMTLGFQLQPLRIGSFRRSTARQADTSALKVGAIRGAVFSRRPHHYIELSRVLCIYLKDCLYREYTGFFDPMELEFYDPEVDFLCCSSSPPPS